MYYRIRHRLAHEQERFFGHFLYIEFPQNMTLPTSTKGIKCEQVGCEFGIVVAKGILEGKVSHFFQLQNYVKTQNLKTCF